MFPIGHLSAGYLFAYFFLKRANVEDRKLWLGVGTFLGLLPDSDCLAYPFLAAYMGWDRAVRISHHAWITHTPLFYVLLGLLVVIYSKKLGCLVTGESLLHLLCDSVVPEDGIMWLFPLSYRKFSLCPNNLHGWAWISFYVHTYGFALELALLALALSVRWLDLYVHKHIKRDVRLLSEA